MLSILEAYFMGKVELSWVILGFGITYMLFGLGQVLYKLGVPNIIQLKLLNSFKKVFVFGEIKYI